MSIEHDSTGAVTMPLHSGLVTSCHRAVVDPIPSGLGRIKKTLSEGGFRYSFLYATRRICQAILCWLDRRLVKIEQRRCLTQPWTISARRFTAADNRQLWNGYDWSKLGEEWTKSDEWKKEILSNWLLPFFAEGKTFVEIGPGGGRWTEILQKRASKLFVVDVADAPLQLCRKRFESCKNIEYLLGDGHTIDVPASSIDAIWSYDVFVHITPLDVKGYFEEFRRILKPGGHAVVHHAGPPVPGKVVRPGWRSDLTDQMVGRFANECGLQIVSQTRTLVNPGDVLTILKMPG